MLFQQRGSVGVCPADLLANGVWEALLPCLHNPQRLCIVRAVAIVTRAVPCARMFEILRLSSQSALEQLRLSLARVGPTRALDMRSELRFLKSLVQASADRADERDPRLRVRRNRRQSCLGESGAGKRAAGGFTAELCRCGGFEPRGGGVSRQRRPPRAAQALRARIGRVRRVRGRSRAVDAARGDCTGRGGPAERGCGGAVGGRGEGDGSSWCSNVAQRV